MEWDILFLDIGIFSLRQQLLCGFITLIVRFRGKLKEKNIYGKNLLLVILVGILFLIFSLYKAWEVGYSFNFRTIVQIGLVVMPAMYVLCFVNIFSTKSIINLMKATTIILVIIYFCEPNHNILSFFNIENWAKINLSKSNSFTESSMCAEAFLQLFLFFYYFSKKKNMKSDKTFKIYVWINFVFTILSFKRLGMLFAISIIVLEKIVDFKGKISPKFAWLFTILFTVGTILYTKFMQGEIFINIDVYKFSTGRDYILSLWEKKDYLSYGYGTSMLVIDRYLEMDLIQIYMELNIIALFVFCFAFFKIAGSKIYSILIMLYTFVNLLTASSLPWSLGWIILLLTVVLISSGKAEKEGYEFESKDTKYRKLFSPKKIKNENKENAGE